MADRAYRGHPILGGIAGFLFGGFVGADLFLFGIVPLASIVLTLAPFVGLVVGILLGLWAPLRRGRTRPVTPPAGSSDPAPAGVD